MANVDLKSLIGTLNAHCKRSLEQAASLCMNRGHYEVSVEHLLSVLLEDGSGDVPQILGVFDTDPQRVKVALLPALETMKKGNTGRPVFSPFLLRLMGRAWMIASIDYKAPEVRSGMLLLALLESPARYGSGDWLEELEGLSQETLKNRFYDIVLHSSETKRTAAQQAAAQAAGGGEAGAGGPAIGGAPGDGSALSRYAMNFTKRAREGNIDPVFGRDREIRQMIDILARRRKNNPIIVGDAGVGKTAMAEGLAVRIVEGDVPDVLRGVELIALDLGLLQAGAGVKGEFEARVKQVIDEVMGSPVPIILFIDEAHTMIGAGGAEGGSDAANLLKPALARGELRTIAATTWSEYKKYFEKDAALTRRFQLVKLDEPSVADTTTMLRGLRSRYEASHGVIIRDDALVAAAALGARYITGRFHPDKGIDLVDTSAARVRVALTSRPAELEDAERRIATCERELEALQRDADQCGIDATERVGELTDEISKAADLVESLTAQWMAEKEAAEAVVNARAELTGLQQARPDIAQDDPDLAAARAAVRAALATLHAAQGKDPLVNVEVTPEVIGRVVSDWTGIPLGKMVRDEASSLLRLEGELQSRIKGQDHALEVLAQRVRASKAGLGNPKAPMGVFLFVGPSGVGKTETALGVADLLFGGEKFCTTINMSEFQEKHTVSRLIGSPPGYIGYGEGGVLTEAVRQRPYSVVLLDEVEKAHPEVLNLFYQVFDKGMLSDGEGRVVDFKDTIIFLTSNLASDITMEVCGNGEKRADLALLNERIRPVLNKHFKPALLARMSVVPYYPIGSDIMREIVDLKLNRLRSQLMTGHKMRLVIEDEVLDTITRRCTMAETGARNIDYIINGSLLPRISTEVLEQMAEGALPDTLRIGVEDGQFTFRFEDRGHPVVRNAASKRAQEAVESAVEPVEAPAPPTLAPGPAEVDEVAAAETAMMEQMIAEAADAPAEVVVEEEPAIEQAAEPAIEQAVEATPEPPVAPRPPDVAVSVDVLADPDPEGPLPAPEPALSPAERARQIAARARAVLAQAVRSAPRVESRVEVETGDAHEIDGDA
ncbi:MAG: type VI secretion system ATPase TssH [bacterium]